jgi:heme a synthase
MPENTMRKLALVATLLAFVVVVLGAYVRLSDAGLGCPDWPGCYGRIIPPTETQAIVEANSRYPERAVEVGKAWKEQVHRYAASLLGLLILALLVLSERAPGSLRTGWLPRILLLLVLAQGTLGMWTVTLLLKPLVVTAHLLGGLSTLALLFLTWLKLGPLPGATDEGGRNSLRPWVVAALAVLMAQIALGGWTSTNYAAWACGAEFPGCHGVWWPDMDFDTGFTLWHGLGRNYEYGILDTPARTAIHFTHRLFAIVATLTLGATAWRFITVGQGRLPRVGLGLAGLLLLQLALGISNVVFALPLWVAVGHNAGAALLLLCLVAAWQMTAPAAGNRQHTAESLPADLSAA